MEERTYLSARHHRGRAFLGSMTVISLLLHVGGVAGVYYLAALAPRLSPPPQTVLVTKLVRLGEVRPKEFLPQKETPPPPPPPPPPANVAPAEPSKPAPVTPPSAKVPQKKAETTPAPATDANSQNTKSTSDAASAALARLKKQFGAKDGSTAGDVSDAELQVIGNRYATELTKCLQANFEVQGVDRNSMANLMAKVVIRIRRDGVIMSAKVSQSSGMERFDRFAERAAEKCHKISPPPAELRATVQSGIDVDFTP